MSARLQSGIVLAARIACVAARSFQSDGYSVRWRAVTGGGARGAVAEVPLPSSADGLGIEAVEAVLFEWRSHLGSGARRR